MKKSICILTSLALIVCALFAVVGCGDKEDTRSSRELDTNILNIWQDSYGSVWVELENYEHDDYQFVSISSQSATSIDFSLDGGKTWHLCDVAESLFPEKDRGVYQIISPGTDGTFTFQLTGAEDNQFPDPSPIYNAATSFRSLSASPNRTPTKRARGQRQRHIPSKPLRKAPQSFLHTTTAPS